MWTDGKAEVGGVKEEKKKKWRRSEKRKGEKKEDASARKGRKVAIHCVVEWFVAQEVRKVGSLKRRVRSQPASQIRDEKLHAVVARSTFPSKNAQSTPPSDHFWKLKCSKSSRRWLPSQKCQQLTASNHFWKLRCRKSACCCGANTFPSQKCQKLMASDHFWKLRCRKSACRCGANTFPSQTCKQLRVSDHFGSWDVEKAHAVVAQNTFPSQKCKQLRVSDHFWKLRCRKSACRCGAKQVSKSKVSKTDGLRPLLEVEMSKKCTL